MKNNSDQINVAVGAIKNAKGEILISKRPKGKHLAGVWEFPGGKIEPGESTQQALVRELQEELDIVPTQTESLIQIEHQYLEKKVKTLKFLSNSCYLQLIIPIDTRRGNKTGYNRASVFH